ncbi:MAG: VanZ family protein [Lachnotalea sp.]
MVGYLLDSMSYLEVGFLIWCVFMLTYEMILKMKKRIISWVQRIGMLLIGLYAVVVFSITVSPMYGFNTNINWQLVNFIPGQAYKSMSVNPLNLWGNILMFVPFGFIIPLLSRRFRNARSIIFLGAGLSFAIEFCQLFLGRGTDIDDLILNILGTIIGYLMSLLVLRIMPKLKVYTGITVKRSGKKVFQDKGPILMLIVVMLLSVMIVGFYKRNQYMDAPIVQIAVNEEQKNEEQKNEEQKNEEQKNEEQKREEEKSEVSAFAHDSVITDKRFENISLAADAVYLVCVGTWFQLHKTNKQLVLLCGEKVNLKFNMSVELFRNKEELKNLKKQKLLIKKTKLGWFYAPDKVEAWLEKMETEGFNLCYMSKVGVTGDRALFLCDAKENMKRARRLVLIYGISYGFCIIIYVLIIFAHLWMSYRFQLSMSKMDYFIMGIYMVTIVEFGYFISKSIGYYLRMNKKFKEFGDIHY